MQVLDDEHQGLQTRQAAHPGHEHLDGALQPAFGRHRRGIDLDHSQQGADEFHGVLLVHAGGGQTGAQGLESRSASSSGRNPRPSSMSRTTGHSALICV